MEAEKPSDFIREIVETDLRAGTHGGAVVTRFPPEPNGYLHIGHAKSICLNFGIAREYGGRCHLRFDDSNPTTEDMEFVRSIQEDVRWLGFDWGEHLHFASDYFEALYDYALALIEQGLAYVDSSSEAEIRERRGTVTEPGTPGPFRDRSIAENRELFTDMRAGKYPDGAHVLRARIDLASPNMKMRDPLLYRIRHAHHYRTLDRWCIYPLYDFTHCLSDSIERITHSICTLEFENNRELYDWILEHVGVPEPRPHQYEFARLNLNYTVMSKRRFIELVETGKVRGWDDPRMPTLAGVRRRGYTPEALRAFAARIGVSKHNSVVELGLLEFTAREDLDPRSPRAMAVLRPLELVIDGWPAGKVDTLDAPYWPDAARPGSRPVPMSGRLYIERDDFALEPPRGWHRLAPGARVRLRHSEVIECTGVETDAAGEPLRVRAKLVEPTARVKGTLHWVSAEHAVDAEVRLYERLFSAEQPGSDGRDVLDDLNPDSLVVVTAKCEPSLAAARPGERFQFERQGYFYVDPVDSRPGAPIFNRTVTLRDTWAKLVQREQAPAAEAEREAREVIHVESELPPGARALRDAHGLDAGSARVLAGSPALEALFRGALAAGAEPRAAASWLVSELPASGVAPEAARFDGPALAALIALVERGAITRTVGKEVLIELARSGGAPEAIVGARGAHALDEGALAALVDEIIAANAPLVARYRAGNPNLLGALVGQVMKRSAGRADAKRAGELLRARLG
ncbi:MAG: glutamine--tRNA ligase/YqeY domain fusion protein [Sorangiineae bacterium]|nr:glutamine--tRNA ligase/YqeY domain fusion protein [Polyangiaceae bacterium]MEB2325132.1 glutamine--tRNA ligase/YqeY domain fusion protein [Sorangiineae bacterium]